MAGWTDLLFYLIQIQMLELDFKKMALCKMRHFLSLILFLTHSLVLGHPSINNESRRNHHHLLFIYLTREMEVSEHSGISNQIAM